MNLATEINAAAASDETAPAELQRLRSRVTELESRLEDTEEVIHAIRHGEVDAFVVNGEQTTAEVRTLQAAGGHYLQLIDEVGQVGFWDWNLHTGRFCCSLRMRDILRLPTVQEVGPRDLLKLIDPSDRKSLRRTLKQCIRFHDHFSQDVRIADGSQGAPRWVMVLARVMTDGVRLHKHLIGVCIDVTEQKRVYESLLQSEEALRVADRKKDEFLAMLAHELRNPLAAIQYALEASTQGLCKEAELTQVIQHQLKHLTHLTDDLLDVSRISTGKIQLKRQHVDGADILRQAVSTVCPPGECRRHEVSIDVSPEAMPLYGDPARLEQILVNLLTNALKYTPEGGSIHVSAAPESGDVAFRVRDTGVGIAERMLPRIFDLFSQADASLDRSQGGLGIGLTVVRTLVEMHGGSIAAHSAGPDKGSEFTVRLPRDMTRPRSKESQPATQDIADPPLRILIVEDHVAAAQMLGALLSSRGHTVECVHDGLRAVEVAEAFRPDVVLLDIGLPGQDGYEVANQLRASEITRTAEIIGLSGYGQERDLERCRTAGFDHHVTKPCGLDELLPLLKRRPVSGQTSETLDRPA